MTISYTQYDQIRENSTNATAIFALTASMRQAQIYLKVANVTNQSALVRIYHDDDGTTYDESTAIVWDLKITPGEFLEVDHLFVNNSSGRVAYRSSVANALTVTVYAIVDYL